MEKFGVPRNCRNYLAAPWLPLGATPELHIGEFWVRSVVGKLNWVTGDEIVGLEILGGLD